MLHAGPVRVLFADGDLRQVRRDGTEIVRRIYVAIRDLDWNTLPGEISDLQIADDGGKFRIRFTRRHRSGGLDYQWQAEIDGEADGTIRYQMHGAALSAFPYAKIGICIHHPTDGFAGQLYHGAAPGGPVERPAAGCHRPADSPGRRHRPAALRAGQRPGGDARVRGRGPLRVQRRPVGDGGPAQLDRRLVQVGLHAGQPRLPPRGRRGRSVRPAGGRSGPRDSRSRRRRPARTPAG